MTAADFEVGPLSAKAKRVCLLKYENQLVMTAGVSINKESPTSSVADHDSEITEVRGSGV